MSAHEPPPPDPDSPRRRAAAPCLAGALALAGLVACEQTVPAGAPIDITPDTEAQIQRYVRRLHLDATGAAPSDPELTTATARLRERGNTAAARGELVAELVASERFSAAWIEQLESTIYGGNSLAAHYGMLCGIARADPACSACAAADPCACACPSIQILRAERDALGTSAADLRAGDPTATIERRYARATGYFAQIGTPEARVRALFDDFLARAAEPDEVENGRAMVLGALVPGAPAGLLFHRHGASYADLLDIVFDSEVYREAIVRRVLERYLARAPRAAELAALSSTIDAVEPDARALVRAALASREYFDQ